VTVCFRLSADCLEGINLNIITNASEASKIADEYHGSQPVDDMPEEELFTLCQRFGFEVSFYLLCTIFHFTYIESGPFTFH